MYDSPNNGRGEERTLVYTTDIEGILFEMRDPVVSSDTEEIGARKYVIHVIAPSGWGMERMRIDAAEIDYLRKMGRGNGQ